jgi:hypothetical protein
MRLKMSERRALTRVVSERYQASAGKREKGLILDQFTADTGYDRSYARTVLRNFGRKIRTGAKIYVGGKAPGTRGRKRQYDEEVLAPLVKIWKILDYPCGKRLAPVIAEMVDILWRFGELAVTAEVAEKLSRIGASTIDRLLAPERRRHELRGRGHTKPGTLLKRQIPIRTFTEWDEALVGFTEIDLVGHDGGNSAGEFLFTLVVTDVASGWTEARAVRNKAQVWVFEALRHIRGELPFGLLGIDSDNGSEFINDHLLTYCRDERITFTRSRPYRKNDACFVEQKNYTVVRRHVGYQRLAGDDDLALLNELYSKLRLYVNFFQPSMKLATRARHGSRIVKTWDKAATPYRRLISSPEITDGQKRRLTAQYERLNPAALIRAIESLRNKLLKLAREAPSHSRKPNSWDKSNSALFSKKTGTRSPRGGAALPSSIKVARS